MARTEMPAGGNGDGPGSGPQNHFRVFFQELARHRNEALFRGGNAEVRKNFSGNPFVDENAAMLRVILELDDVAVPVVGFKQMRLSAASHLTNEMAGI